VAALLTANNQITAELAAARAQAARLAEADKTAHKTAAIAEALAGAPLINKAAATQLTAYIDRAIMLQVLNATKIFLA
jgi:FMN-dependent NADH-azoreductase